MTTLLFLAYQVILPVGYTPAQKWPVILFLHGAGERGTDNEKQLKVGIGPVASRVPAIIVLPQAPEDTRWIGQPADDAIRALDTTIRDFNGDSKRVYLTGLSMGGYGAWHIAMSHPDRFAALAVICGGLLPHKSATSVTQSPLIEGTASPYRSAARKLKHIPVWIFHGDKDTVIPVDESRWMALELRAAGADVRYTEYEGVGHGSWLRAYDEPELFEWMLRQSR